jgi:hypothetical protein
MLLKYMLYFCNCNLCFFYLLNWFKPIILDLLIIIQFLIKGSKIFCCDILIKTIFALDHPPETSGLIFEHVWSLFGKLQTCFLADFEVCPGSCNATCVPLTMFPSFLSHCPFSFSTFLSIPWCQRFAPLIGVSWCGNFYFFNHPSADRLLQYKLFYCRSAVFICHGFIFRNFHEFLYKYVFICFVGPCLCWLGIVMYACASYPFVYCFFSPFILLYFFYLPNLWHVHFCHNYDVVW